MVSSMVVQVGSIMLPNQHHNQSPMSLSVSSPSLSFSLSLSLNQWVTVCIFSVSLSRSLSLSQWVRVCIFFVITTYSTVSRRTRNPLSLLISFLEPLNTLILVLESYHISKNIGYISQIVFTGTCVINVKIPLSFFCYTTRLQCL